MQKWSGTKYKKTITNNLLATGIVKAVREGGMKINFQKHLHNPKRLIIFVLLIPHTNVPNFLIYKDC